MTVATFPLFPDVVNTSLRLFRLSPPEEVSFINLPELKLVLLGEISPGWQVINPLTITLQPDEDESYIASDDIYAIYGDGNTPSEATQDYIISLIDYYELLAEAAENNPANEALFRHLRTYIRPSE